MPNGKPQDTTIRIDLVKDEINVVPDSDACASTEKGAACGWMKRKVTWKAGEGVKAWAVVLEEAVLNRRFLSSEGKTWGTVKGGADGQSAKYWVFAVDKSGTLHHKDPLLVIRDRGGSDGSIHALLHATEDAAEDGAALAAQLDRIHQMVRQLVDTAGEASVAP